VTKHAVAHEICCALSSAETRIQNLVPKIRVTIFLDRHISTIRKKAYVA